MSHRGVLVGFTFAICLLVAGCQSTSSLGALIGRHNTSPGSTPQAAPALLASGTEVEWHIKTAKEAPNGVNAGRSYIGPDGTIELGPYGSCKIGGMTLAQASTALEKHLAKYLRAPTVTIAMRQPEQPAGTELAWRPAGSPIMVAGGAPAANKDRAIQVAGFQTSSLGGDKKDPEAETIPAPRVMGPVVEGPIVGGPVPPGVFGPQAPNECRLTLLPPYRIGPTDVLQIDSLEGLKTQPVRGPHLVGPDGAVRVGVYGSTIVAGLTVDEAKATIARLIASRLEAKVIPYEDVLKNLSVDVLAYNSKQFFIVTDGAGLGEQVIALPVTGNDTVLNAMAKINGLPLVASKHRIWVARSNCPGCPQTLLPVDWIGMTQRGEGMTNWQIMPGDRIYVKADVFRTFDTHLAKILQPIERIFGGVLLGSETVNSIRGTNNGSSGTR
jgi:polysaccharide export outer membrane protein